MEYTLDNINEAFDLLDDEKGVVVDVWFKLKASDNLYGVDVFYNHRHQVYRLYIEYGSNQMAIKSKSQDDVIAMVKHFVEQEF